MNFGFEMCCIGTYIWAFMEVLGYLAISAMSAFYQYGIDSIYPIDEIEIETQNILDIVNGVLGLCCSLLLVIGLAMV